MASQGDQTGDRIGGAGTNFFTPLPDARGGEVVTPLLTHRAATIERIVTLGQVTPPEEPYVQGWDEWVILVSGSASVRIEGQGDVDLAPGDHLFIPANARHWVVRSDPNGPTLWLAVHLRHHR